ncbi:MULTISPECIES: transporter substrate-binding domain-containing protein [Polaromonas]|uniref:Transporter substrate-binding domain-containing protein n=1 Tax=Polaromonas aquatica TaxID=332657 RepID=A0ABW1TZG2_9BURK
MNIHPSVVDKLAPGGVLRASINLGNPILAKLDAAMGKPAGVSVDLALAFAKRLGVPIELLVVDTAGKSVKAVSDDVADIGFFAVDPLRGQEVAFTAPYVLIEGCYVVPEHSPMRENHEVDLPGVRVSVGGGSAYDLYLTRTLKQAGVVRAANSQIVVDALLAQKLDVAAGVRQQLQADVERIGSLRFLPGRFMVIQQAMGLPKSRGEAALSVLRAFVEDVKASGFVAERLARHNIQGATVASGFES